MATSSRPTHSLLPTPFQTETNKKFLSATLDQLIEPSALEKISAYVGQRYNPTYRKNDVYLLENSAQRQSYQLEPTVSYKSDGQTVDFISPYIDTVNEISAQGGSADKHDKLWDSESYSYSPLVDPDKLINFREYYWLTFGPLSVQSNIDSPGSIITINVTNEGLDGWKFNNKTSSNPNIIVYKGNTYKFVIDAPGNPFWIKNDFGTGTDSTANSDYVQNNGADQGTVTLHIPTSDSSSITETVLYYQCEHHQSMQGKFIIKDLAEETFDINENLIGVNQFTDSLGLAYSSGQKITFSGDPVADRPQIFYVENVGRSIQIVDETKLLVHESYGLDSIEPWDYNGTTGWDSRGWGNTIGAVENPDYWTINRASQDFNAWTRSNRWFHRSVIETANLKNNITTVLTESQRAKRPIVEFVQGLQLYNHGTVGRAVDFIDTTTTDALTKFNGALGLSLDQTTVTEGDTVVFLNDPEQKNKIFTIHFDTLGDSSLRLHLDDDSTTIANQTSIYARKGVIQKGKTYHYKNNSWVTSQAKTKIQQKPIFDLFDSDQHSIADTTYYLSTTFTGSTLFEIATDSTQGTPDTVYGTNVIYQKFGLLSDIQINDTFNTGTFQYIGPNGLATFALRQFYAKTNVDNIAFLHNNWTKTANVYPQQKIEEYEAAENQKDFEIKSWSNSAQQSLEVQVFINGKFTVEYSLLDANINKVVRLDTASTKGDLVSIRSYSKTLASTQNGFWEIPVSCKSNPLNKNIEKFTLGDITDHYQSGAYNHPLFSGVVSGNNNTKDLANVFGYSSKVMQHSASVPLASILARDSVINLPMAMRIASTEYEKIKKAIIEHSNTVQLNGTVSEQLDTLLLYINANKNSSMPYFDTDMLAYGTNKNTISYTIEDASIVSYPITSQFDLDVLSNKAIYVYKNDVQLIHGQDYEFTDLQDSSAIIGIKLLTSLAINDVIKIDEFVTTQGSYIPSTPTKLGLAPKFTPRKYTDDTYQPEDSSDTGVSVIEGHDGAITVAYNDFRDDLILEFEKRIYNNIKTTYDHSALNISAGFFRNNDYTSSQYNKMLAKEFYAWTGTNAVDYSTNNTYSSDNPFTYNWRGYSNSIDGTALQGFWRGIYKYWFDTDRPHTAPWEMFEFSQKPSWWDTRYGASPYTGGNLLLWKDVQEGFIADGNRKGYYERYARSGVLDAIPVGDDGSILPPNNANIISGGTSSELLQQSKWEFGDWGPAETAWRKSSSFRFAEQIAKFLAKPGKYAGIFFDTSRIKKNSLGHYVYNGLYRTTIPNYVLPNATSFTSGYINIIYDYVKSLGYSITYIANRLDNLSVQLSYKLGGFSNKDNMNVIVGSYSPSSTNKSVYIPKENFDLYLYKSAPIDFVNYSGVIVEKSTNGYKISGYNNFDRRFFYYQPRKNNNTSTVIVGASTDPYVDWQAGGFYSAGSVVKYENIFYRANSSISSSQTFNVANWSEIGTTLPLKGGVRVLKYKDYLQNVSTLGYGTELRTEQEVSDFLFGYSKYLESKGFVFDQFSTELNSPVDWELSVKEFLFWSIQNWQTSAVITLSPASAQLKFNHPNTIGDDLTNKDQYTVLQQDGFPIQPTNLSTNRNNGVFTISTNPDQDGIYNADVRAVQREHVLLLDNLTSFNDVIYDDTIGVRQDRIKLVGWRTTNWNGDLYSPGYIVDQAKLSTWTAFTEYKKGDVLNHQGKVYVVLENHNSGELFQKTYYSQKTDQPEKDLLPNFDTKAESFRDFYSLDTENFDADQQRYAQHLIGFQTRSYWENLGLDELTQYKFYQGMIRDKGTKKPIQRFKSPSTVQDAVDYNMFEEYAFRVGDYGGYRTQESFSFALSDLKHRQEQQVYKFTQANESDTQNIINVDASEWLKYPYELRYPIFANYSESALNIPRYLFKYPVAGYVQSGQVQHTVFDEQELLSYDASTISEGDRIWMANTAVNDWNIYRASSVANFIDHYVQRDNILQFTTNTQHGLAAGDYVVINNFNNEIDGVYKVTDSPDSTDNSFSFSVEFTGTIDSTKQNGNILKLTTIRINSIDDIETIAPIGGFSNGDNVYVDNDYELGTGLWKVYQLNNNSFYNTVLKFQNNLTDANNLDYGKSLVVNSSNALNLMVGSPGDNSINFYVRNSANENFKVKNELVFTYLNANADDKVGTSVAIISDGTTAFAGSPYSNNIQRLNLSSNVPFSVGRLIYGISSGATGRVLGYDAVNYAIYVKVISGSFTSEGIWLEDSSSVATISSVVGDLTELNQGIVHVISKDQYGSFGFAHAVASPTLGSDEYFGWSVATTNDGSLLFVGAPGITPELTDSGTNPGKVYVYKKTNGVYIYNQTLTPGSSSQNLDRFGQSLSVTGDGSRLIVGSPSFDRTGLADSSTYNAGSVYVFFKSTDDLFYQTQEIIHGVSEKDAEFGTALAINSDQKDLIVGSPNEVIAGNKQGAVYFYKSYSTTHRADGSSTAFTTDFDLESGQVAVTINGSITTSFTRSSNTITFLSAPDADQTIVISQYQQYQKIVQPQNKANSKFGNNLFIANNNLLIQASGYGPLRVTTFDKFLDDGSTQIAETTFDRNSTKFTSRLTNTGSVYVYNKLSNKFIFEQILQPNDLVGEDRFGDAISLYSNEIFVGAPGQLKTNINDSTYQSGGQVYHMKKTSTSASSWEEIVSQPDLIDVDKIKNVQLYNSVENELLSRLEHIDPAKGKLFGEIEQNISFKTIYDPADYDSWDNKQAGQIWLDLSTIKFLWYEQGDLNFRLLNWGKLHPSSQINVKEWTQSEYTPTEYNEISQSSEGVSLGITGTAQNSYSVKSVFDTSLQQFVNQYFFWVNNPTDVPSVEYRTVSGQQIANAISNPKLFKTEYSAVIRQDALLVSYNPNRITDEIAITFEKNTSDDPLNGHTEFALVSKDDATAKIPQSIIDKMYDSLVGTDQNGRSVPDLSVPVSMRYGVGNRPRQSMFKNRDLALQNMVEFVNLQLKEKQYAGSKTLNNWLKKHEQPSQTIQGYKIKVDTEIDLQFLNTETYVTGDTVLVEIDGRAGNRWTLNTFNSQRTFDITKVQEYDTTEFWEYIDWYKSGYDSSLVPTYTVANENTMRTNSYSEGDIIKVIASYDGKFRYYVKTYNGFEVIAIEQGTFALKKLIYDLDDFNLGYDGGTFADQIYDNGLASTELRFIMKGLQEDIFTDDDLLNFNQLFFLLVKFAQVEQKDIDWAFKSSFIKLVSTYNNLEQPPELRFNTTDAVTDFIQEVLPFKSKIRENLEQHKNLETVQGDVTDFDNKSYYDAETQTYIAPRVFYDDSTYFDVYNRYPWKFYSENYKYYIGSIEVGTAGEGYSSTPTVTITGGGGSGATATANIVNGAISSITVTNAGSGYTSSPTITISGGSPTVPAVAAARLVNNKIRSFETTLKFDRLNSNKEITNSTIVDWTQFTLYTQNTNIRIANSIYRANQTFTSGATVTSNVLLSDSTTTGYLDVLTEWSATDRINSYYSPTQGMAGLIGDGSTNIDAYAQLMTGLEYQGTRVLGLKFEEGEGYDVEAYDIARYDATEQDIVDPEDINNVDQLVDSKTFTTSLGTRSEDIDIVGDAFISEYSAHAPEEVLPGGVYDTLDMKIYTQPSTGSGVMSRATYYGDGSTKVFAVPGQINNLDSVRVFVDNQFKLADSTDYDLDVIAKTVTFNSAPQNNAIVTIHTVDVSVESLVVEQEFDGDGSTTQFNITVARSLIQQSYVTVNGVKTNVTLNQIAPTSDDTTITADNTTFTADETGDEGITKITFGSAPADGTKIFVYLFSKESGKAYSEMTTTEYTVNTTSNTVTLDAPVGVIGPFEHKVIVEGVSGTDSTNRYRLSPPQIAYYSGDGSTTSFAVPNHPESKLQATDSTVEVWVNGIYQGDDSSINSDYTLSNDSSSVVTVDLNTAPAVGETVAVILKLGHDYEISNDGSTLTLKNNWPLISNDSSTINNEKIFVTTFTNHDQMNMRTERFQFGPFQNVGDAEFNLSTSPINSDYTFVHLNKQNLTANHQYRIENSRLIIPSVVANNNQINELVISYVSGTLTQPAIGYRIFKDILNRYHYRRLSKEHTTTLAQALSASDTEIVVADGTVLPAPTPSQNIPGVIWIGKERITYFTKSGNTLGQLMRGTLGTAISDTLVSGTKVVDASLVQAIPYTDTYKVCTFMGDGSTTAFTMANNTDSVAFTSSSASELVVQLGGTKITGYTVDGTSTITFSTAPQPGVLVRITKKIGGVWYSPGRDTAADGLGLQGSTRVEVKFLQDSPAELPEN